MQPDIDQLEVFVDAMFRHAGAKGFVSLRAFYEDDSRKPFRITPTALSGGLPFLIEAAQDDANRAANFPKPVVFAPPLAVFADKVSAKEADIIEGLAITVECDARPYRARARLEAILGPATLVVRSGGRWTDPETGEVQDKLHLHWRLRIPARGDELPALKRARDMAARLVGGDLSSKSCCHPIRWPGSWHRKGEPVLCSIETASPDSEIDLDVALAALTAASPAEEPRQKANGKDHSARDGADWASDIRGIISSDNYHEALVALAAKVVAAGMKGGAAVNMLRALMANSTGPRDERWQARYDDVPRAVASAEAKFRQAQEPPRETTGPLIKSSAEFVKDFVPPNYLVDGILQRRYCYAFTARTGDGKTAIALLLTACVDQGIPFGGHATEKGRVLFFAGENPDDIRARWIAMSVAMNFNIDKSGVHFIPGKFKISALIERIKVEVEALGGVALIVVDTSAAFFEEKDENDNVQAGKHAGMLRSLVDLSGGPTVLVNCHPIKNASDDNLSPRGGGAFVAEVDGNLTAIKDDGVVTLHHQIKFRGADFAPLNFMLRADTYDQLRDAKGRLMPAVIARHLSDTAQEEMTAASRQEEDMVMQAIKDGDTSFSDIAKSLGWYTPHKNEPYRSKVQRAVSRLKRAKLVTVERGRHILTEKGKKASKSTATEPLNRLSKERNGSVQPEEGL
jgi:hypothetical protein